MANPLRSPLVRHRALSALVLLLGAGCGTRNEAAGDSSVAPAAADSLQRIPDVSAGPRQDLTFWLDMPREARRGASIPLVFRAVNGSRAPVDLYLRGRDVTLDVEVTDEQGAIVWRRLEDEIIPAIVMLRTIPPGDTLEVRAAWDQRTASGVAVPAGSYRVRGLLLTEGPEPLASPPVPLRILP